VPSSINRDVSDASEALGLLPSPLSSEARSQVLEAIGHIKPGGERLPVLEALVEKNPGDAELTYELARANWRAGDEDEAGGGRSYNQGASFFRNTGEQFEDVTESAFPEDFRPKSGRGAALLDYDSDDDMDIVINCIDSSPMLLENCSPGGTWLEVKLDAPSALVFGTRVVARKDSRIWTRTVDGGSSYLSQSSQTLHFGFGSLRKIDDLTIHWPGRKPQVIESPPLNACIRIRFPYAAHQPRD